MTRRSVTLGALFALAACARQVTENASPDPPAGPRNVVLMVGDGFGVGAWTLGRAWAKQTGRELVLDEPEAIGFLAVHCLDELVTDSGAAATAWSTGQLAPRFQIGFPGNDGAPPLFERLRGEGWAYGIVTTARVTHATPAPFYARVGRRGLEDEIAPQLLAARPAVVLGGGHRHFLPEQGGGRRKDGRDLLAEAKEAGFAVLTELVTPLPTDRPVLGLLESSHLPHELDRTEGEPDLAELAVAAIRRLDSESRPWFLLIEAARIDHAGHDHDGPGLARNTVRLDRALEAVLEETDRSRTLVILASDHGTSNPTLLEHAHPESLGVVSASVAAMEKRIFRGRPWKGTPRALESAALPVLDEGARHTGLTPEDLDRLLAAEDVYERRVALGQAISRRFGISFLPYEDHLRSRGVHGHTADLVPVRAWGPRAREIEGVHDHAELGRWIAGVLARTPGEGAARASAAASIDTSEGAR